MTTHDKSAVGLRMKYYRLSAGLTQGQLASKVGLTKQAISNYENGERDPGPDVRARYCKFFKVDEANLFTDKSIRSIPDEIIAAMNEPDMKEILAITSKSDSDLRKHILKFLQNLSHLSPEKHRLLFKFCRDLSSAIDSNNNHNGHKISA